MPLTDVSLGGAAVSRTAVLRRHDPQATRQILQSLPDWFGIPDAIENYVRDAGRLDSYVAVEGGVTIGVALVNRHFPESAELHLIAVEATQRGRGVGSQLIETVANDLRDDRCRILSVHTVGPSFDDANYAQTRAFYTHVGFVPLQELRDIDWSGPTLILVMPL